MWSCWSRAVIWRSAVRTSTEQVYLLQPDATTAALHNTYMTRINTRRINAEKRRHKKLPLWLKSERSKQGVAKSAAFDVITERGDVFYHEAREIKLLKGKGTSKQHTDVVFIYLLCCMIFSARSVHAVQHVRQICKKESMLEVWIKHAVNPYHWLHLVLFPKLRSGSVLAGDQWPRLHAAPFCLLQISNSDGFVRFFSLGQRSQEFRSLSLTAGSWGFAPQTALLTFSTQRSVTKVTHGRRNLARFQARLLPSQLRPLTFYASWLWRYKWWSVALCYTTSS